MINGIPKNEEELLMHSSVFLMEINKIKPNSQQPRTEFNEEKLRDLSESIRQYGVLQPLVVTRMETETASGIFVEYELIAGERRLRASKLAGLSTVPVVIRKENNEKMKLELAIIENLQREDLNAMERSRAFKKLADNFKLKHHEIAARIGKSREYVSNTIRLLGLPEEIQNGLAKGEVSEGHCRVILSLDGRLEEQMAIYNDVVARRMNVRQTERMVRNIVNGKLISEGINIELKFIEKRLSETLGTKVHIEMIGGRGKISIDFFSDEELNSFLKKMIGEKNKTNEITDIENATKDEAVKSVDGILEKTRLPLPEKETPEVDPVEELLKNFSI